MATVVKHALDQNKSLSLELKYDPETKLVSGGLLSDYSGLSKIALLENTAEITHIVINGQEVPLVSTDKNVGPQQYEAQFEYTAADTDTKIPLEIKLKDQ